MRRWIGCWVVGLLLISGCARTVTQIVDYGEQMTVLVTLNGPADVNANRYFMVLSSDSNLKTPLPSPDNIDYEMIEPGTTPQRGSVEAYYTTYYSTWSGYIIADSGGYFLVDGPFVQGQATTREPLSTVGETSATLTYTVRLGQIFQSGVPDTIYFDVVSVPWPSGGAKLPADHLNSTNAYISKVSGSTQTVDDTDNAYIDPAANIIKCTVTIQ